MNENLWEEAAPGCEQNLWKDSVSVENDWQLEIQFCGETGMLQVQRLITLPCVKFWPSRTAISYPALRQN